MSTIIMEHWLVYELRKNPGHGVAPMSVRVTTRKPSLSPKERAIKINVSIPKAVFVTPEIVASLEVNETHVVHPVIEMAVQDASGEGGAS